MKKRISDIIYGLNNHIAKLYFKKVMRLYGIPRSMVLDQDTKFLSHFWTTLWKMIRSKLKCTQHVTPKWMAKWMSLIRP